MIVTDRLVFLELQKCASSATAQLIQDTVGGDRIGKHNRLDSIQLDIGVRRVAGTVRDPWSWYVSLWRFGCRGRGAVHRRLTTRSGATWHQFRQLWEPSPCTAPGRIESLRRTAEMILAPTSSWRELYDDPADLDNFREWLRRVLDPDACRQVGEGYQEARSHGEGLLTHRFMALYGVADPRTFDPPGSDVIDLERETVLDDCISTEAIGDGLIAVFDAAGYDLSAEARERIVTESDRLRHAAAARDYRPAYDEDLAELVGTLDGRIIRTFGFRF